MNVLVLMAGRGQRFVDAGYTIPKPLIKVNGKTILQWTTESCPYIKHNGTNQSVNLYFAVLQEHIDAGLDTFLYSVYGNNITIVPFTKVTRGNLDTAYISCNQMLDDDLLILDSDNKYNGNSVDKFISELPSVKNLSAIFVFDTLDKSLPNKWSNARIEDGKVRGIREKDNEWNEYPALIGMFYFSSTSEFLTRANTVLTEYTPVKGEYYMSMVPANLYDEVYAHYVTDVVPLGTPQDVLLFGEV